MQDDISARHTMVVDITYMCNAQCRYCKWGDSTTQGRTMQDLEKILIPAETLKILDTKRIVISGGEPRLHPNITDILRYYKKLVEEVIIITNGYDLDEKELDILLDSGATGITISLDSVDAMESFMTRRTPPTLHKKILANLKNIAESDHIFELGINCTVSHVTANWITVNEMLKFGKKLDVDFIKFQPIFDDGYVSVNSSDLLLSTDDVIPLLDIARRLDTRETPPTNPSQYWIDIATMTEGKQMPSHQCALSASDAICTDGKLSICYWVDSSHYGSSDKEIIHNRDSIVTNFERDKQKCKVGFHCFCNQGMEHTWLTK